MLLSFMGKHKKKELFSIYLSKIVKKISLKLQKLNLSGAFSYFDLKILAYLRLMSLIKTYLMKRKKCMPSFMHFFVSYWGQTMDCPGVLKFLSFLRLKSW